MKLTFDQWKQRVDIAVGQLCGMSADDLPDWDYWNAYEDGISPSSAARAAIRAAKGEF